MVSICGHSWRQPRERTSVRTLLLHLALQPPMPPRCRGGIGGVLGLGGEVVEVVEWGAGDGEVRLDV